MYIFVLPAYNEERCLGTLLHRIQEVMKREEREYRVLVVDDGSTDGTAGLALSLAREMPITLLSHAANQGLGAALRTGLRAACDADRGESVVITMDADDTHDPCATVPMWRQLQEGQDVVVASRYGPQGGEVGVVWARRLCSKVICTLLQALFPIPGVHDYSSGYRLYRSSILRRGLAVWGDDLVSERGFTCMAEVLLKLRRLGARISEVGVAIRYDRKQSASKLRVVQTILLYLRLIAREILFEARWRLATRRTAPLPVDVEEGEVVAP